jgi:hypothetical protein
VKSGIIPCDFTILTYFPPNIEEGLALRDVVEIILRQPLNLLKPSAKAKKREEKRGKEWEERKAKKREKSKTPKSKHKLISFLRRLLLKQ